MVVFYNNFITLPLFKRGGLGGICGYQGSEKTFGKRYSNRNFVAVSSSELNLKQRTDGVFLVDAHDGLGQEGGYRQGHDLGALFGRLAQGNGVGDHQAMQGGVR